MRIGIKQSLAFIFPAATNDATEAARVIRPIFVSYKVVLPSEPLA
jgi:hypothetical protein